VVVQCLLRSVPSTAKKKGSLPKGRGMTKMSSSDSTSYLVQISRTIELLASWGFFTRKTEDRKIRLWGVSGTKGT
jgi:hypothetical protein